MADDFFADLVGTTGLKPTANPQPMSPPAPTLKPLLVGSTSLKAPVEQSSGSKLMEPIAMEDLLDSNGTTSKKQPPGFTKDELEAVVKQAVDSTLEASMSKFVRSLRTVLEDMGKRIEVTGAACASLKDTVVQLRDAHESQAENVHARFTNLDIAVKEVERGVQSMRDKQELLEAQAMLARLSSVSKAEEAANAKAAAATAPPQQQQQPETPVATAGPAQAAPQPPPAVALQPQPAAPPMPMAPPAPIVPAAPPPPPPPPPGHGPPPPPPGAPPPPPGYMGGPGGPPPPPGAPPPPPPPPSSAPPGYGPGAYANYTQAQQMQPNPDGYHTAQAPPPPPPPPPPQYAPYAPPPPPPHQPPPQPPPMPGAPPMHGPPPPPYHALPPMPQGPQYPAPPPGNYPPPYRAGPPSQGAPHHMGGGGGGAPGGGGGAAGGGGGGGPARTVRSSIPLDQIIADISAMGFSRSQVMGVVNQLQSSGQAVDLNIILDRLTNGRA